MKEIKKCDPIYDTLRIKGDLNTYEYIKLLRKNGYKGEIVIY